MSIRLLQLTDMHLFAYDVEQFKGVPTRASFAETLDHIRQAGIEFDPIVLTGDLAHGGKEDAYRTLREMIQDWRPRCRVIPGNHDDRALLQNTFVASSGVPGRVTFSFAADAWRLIGLDSLIEGELAGGIDDEQLLWLEKELAAHPESPTLVFVHHPPVPIGSPWIDEIGLREPDALLKLIEASKQIRAVVAGHVHQEFEGSVGEAKVFTTPATSVQFVPRRDEPICDHVPPGYRAFELKPNGEFETRVIRLPELTYPPAE